MAKKPADKEGVRLVLLNHERKMLLVRQASRWQWQFPGGELETGEKPKIAVLREAMEETQIRCSQVTRIHEEHILWPDHSEMIHCFSGTATNTSMMRPDGKEIDALGWVSLHNTPRFKMTGTTRLLLQNISIINLFV